MAEKTCLWALLCLIYSAGVHAAVTVDLGSRLWRLQNGNESISLKTTLPAYPLEVLRSNRVIKDPNYRYGELESRWVAEDDWTFSLEFSGRATGVQDLLAQEQVLLLLDGIDTFATVTLNDEEILQPNNFHRSWMVPVKNMLNGGINTLQISLKPAMTETKSLKAANRYSIPVIQQMGAIGAYTFARKPASDFGWDWGPAYAASGIYGSVKLLGFDHAYLQSAYVAQHKRDIEGNSRFKVDITSQLLVPPLGDKGQLVVEIPELNITHKQDVVLRDSAAADESVMVKSSMGMTVATINTNISIDARRVNLWWPVGYGKQPLYDVSISFVPQSVAAACSQKQIKSLLPLDPEEISDDPEDEEDDDGDIDVDDDPEAEDQQTDDAGLEENLDVQQADDTGLEAGMEVQALLETGTRKVVKKAPWPSKAVREAGAVARTRVQEMAGGEFIVEVAAEGPAASGDLVMVASVAKAPEDPVSAEAPADPVSAVTAIVSRCAAAAQDGISTVSHKIGFRTVELIRLPIHKAMKDLFPEGEAGWNVKAGFQQDKSNLDGHWAVDNRTGDWQHFAQNGDQSNIQGESFYFKINGVPMYMKGANLIPSHIVHSSVTEDILKDTLDYAVQSNMNMIRVWGGGRYPDNFLLDYADEHGLLIWMEAMFACSPYPRDAAFLDNVAAEVAQQAQRISWHPSVVIWGGNNEIEGSLNWYAESRSNMQLFANDYEALFVNTIRRVLRQINPNIPFVDSSPSNGVIADNDQEYIKRWGDDWDWRFGDVHHYAYDTDCEDWTTYPKAKFISEFGWQSYPTFATYAEATSAKDWQVDNPMTGFRNRRFGNGLDVFEKQFKRHFRLPESWSAANDPAQALKLFQSFLYITHMQQARCYETAINYWRRLRSQPAGLNMGVLYWQLNDIAQFASWSSYDYGGRWKPLAYSIKRMFAPLQVQAFVDEDAKQIKVFLVNDYTTPLPTRISISLLSVQHHAVSCSSKGAMDPVITFNYEVPPGWAAEVWSVGLSTMLNTRSGCDRNSCFVLVTATVQGSNAAAGQTSETQLWLAPLKNINLPDPELKLSGFKQATLKDAGEAGLSADSDTQVDAAQDDTVAAAEEEGVINGDGDNEAVFDFLQADGGSRRLHYVSAKEANEALLERIPGRVRMHSQSADAGTPITFTLSSTRPAALTSFVTKYRGRFSDDAFTAIHPCMPKQVTFYPHSSVGPLSAARLKADLQVVSLFNHQYGTAPTAATASSRAKHGKKAVLSNAKLFARLDI